MTQASPRSTGRLRTHAVSAVNSPRPRLDRALDGTVEVPAGSAVTGWFADGPHPGPAGPAVILGCVESAGGPGVSYRLAGLNPGAGGTVPRAGGSSNNNNNVVAAADAEPAR
jgi:hypothetical protein